MIEKVIILRFYVKSHNYPKNSQSYEIKSHNIEIEFHYI